jgi:hypothetical protein
MMVGISIKKPAKKEDANPYPQRGESADSLQFLISYIGISRWE